MDPSLEATPALLTSASSLFRKRQRVTIVDIESQKSMERHVPSVLALNGLGGGSGDGLFARHVKLQEL
jgi:hypothetical protein